MNMFIVATDFSPNAFNALQYAAALAARTNASIVLYNAFQIPVHAANARISAAGVDDLIRANKEKLTRLAREIESEYKIRVSVETKQQELSEGLDELVAEKNADMVIMGLHANDWSDRLFGNNATAIIRTSQYPVLVIPPDATFTAVKKILYPYDTNRINSPDSFNLLTELASKFKASVQVFHVRTKKESINPAAGKTRQMVYSEIETALEKVPYQYKDIDFQHVIEGIENEMTETGANLLVMVPHKLSMWESLLNQSVTRSMALRTHIPLLVLPGVKVVMPLEVDNN